MSFCDNSYSTQNSMNASKSKSMFASGRWLLLGFLVLGFGNGVGAIAAGRRRRRSLYNVRPCGPGEKAIWTPSKKKVESCVSCEKGKYRSDTSHALEECMLCAGGRHSSDDLSYCIGDICKVGSYGFVDTIVCKQCPVGKYSGKVGVFACKDCESGRFMETAGANHCQGDMCPAGKWGIGGSVSQDAVGVCSPCEAGKYSLAGSTSCQSCPDGKYSAGGTGSCIDHKKCPRNSYLLQPPPTDSPTISCKRCIYSSDYYFAAFVFAITVASLNTMVFLSHPTSYHWALLFVICPCVWSIFMNICRNKPGVIPATISILMNISSLFPTYFCVRKMCDVKIIEFNKKLYGKKTMQSNNKVNVVTVSCAV